MMKALHMTAQNTSEVIRGLVSLKTEYKIILKDHLQQIFSRELINYLFKHPSTKIEFLIEELGVHRNCATKYLEQLVDMGLLEKHKIGKEIYSFNKKLFLLLSIPIRFIQLIRENE